MKRRSISKRASRTSAGASPCLLARYFTIARASVGCSLTSASDAALLDVIFGRFAPTGKLPFELPSSMEAVRQQKEDLPYDSENPTFAFGFGLRYEAE